MKSQQSLKSNCAIRSSSSWLLIRQQLVPELAQQCINVVYTADRASRVVTVRDDKFYSYQCFVMCQDDFTRTDWANSNQQVMKAFSNN